MARFRKGAPHEIALAVRDALPKSKVDDVELQYLCSILCELSYFSLTGNEIDKRERAKALFPKFIFAYFYGHLTLSEITAASGDFEIRVNFEVRTEKFVAVGIRIKKVVYVSFRGTNSFRDWKINLAVNRTKVWQDDEYISAFLVNLQGPDPKSVHRGFYDEAVRITKLIKESVPDFPNTKFVFTGHSLGGAVATISSELIGGSVLAELYFGTPRIFKYECTSGASRKLYFRRAADIVPHLPTRSMGYHDSQETRTIGSAQPEILAFMFQSQVMRTILFFLGLASAHSITRYRRDVGSKLERKFYARKLASRGFFNRRLELSNV